MLDTPAISLLDVSVHFFKKTTRITAVSHISLDLAPGSFVALLGPSGCGKSTLMHCMAGLQTPTSGQVICNGRPVLGPNIGIGYMTQRDALLPWRTVEANLQLPFNISRTRGRTPWQKGTDSVAQDRIKWALDMVGLSAFKHHYPRELSGGMLKRASLAQTLAASPSIILMDEPFGTLDAQLKLQMHREVMKIWEAEKPTIIFVTHDIEEAIALCDAVVVLASHPGRIKQVVEVDLPRPRDPVKIRFDQHFRDLHQQIWDLIDTPEMTAAME
jgi:NitT/TauT family transport system ATP-binding protein